MHWDNALDGYWLEKRKNFSKATVDEYGYTFRRFRAFLGEGVQFEQISSDQIRQFLNDLKDQGLSPKTVLNAWVTLSSLWTWAEHELQVPHIIRGRVARPKYRRREIDPYTRTDINAMLNAATKNAAWTSRNGKVVEEHRSTGLRDRAILLTLFDSGIRASELCALTVGDYEQKSGRLHIRHGKGNKARYVFLGDTARKSIWRYLATRPDARLDEPLFYTRNGAHIERNSLRHMINRCAERAGVTGATVHRFRHTFAINFLRNGGSVLELQRLLGHERMETLRVYAMLAETDLAAAQRRASPADNWRL